MMRERSPSEPLLGPYHGLPESLAGAARDAGVNAVWFHMFQEEQFERCARWGFTPLIYAQKSGRGVEWGREYLQASVAFVPDGRRVQLILDAIDLPGSLREAARSAVPSWGIQVFDGARLLENDTDRRELAAGLQAIRASCLGGPFVAA